MEETQTAVIAHDSPGRRQDLLDHLISGGYRSVAAESAHAARCALEADDIDAVVVARTVLGEIASELAADSGTGWDVGDTAAPEALSGTADSAGASEASDAPSGSESARGLVNAVRREYHTLVAHELNNLLTPLVGMSELLAHALSEEGNSRLTRTATAVHETARKATDFIDKLREVSAIELGRRPLTRRRGRLDALTESVVRQLLPIAHEHGIELELPSSPETLEADFDFDMMPRSIEYLLRSALRHLEYTEGVHGRRMSVTLREVDEQVVLEVGYSGAELSSRQVREYFEPYSSAGGGDRAAQLTLRYARLVAEAHNGAVGVTSGENGVQIWLRIPRFASAPEAPT